MMVLRTVFVIWFLAFSGICEAEAVSGQELGLENVVITHYALGADASGKKAFEEGIYLSKGDVNEAFSDLKAIIFDGKKSVRTFKMKDRIEIIVFRGTFLKLSKIGIKKVIMKDFKIEIYAEYTDFPDSDVHSQPAALIPLGQLPPGKYAVILFVDSKLRNGVDFQIH